MQIFSELRYPSRWYTKILMVLLALAFFALLAISAIAGFLVYRIVKPQRSSGEISLSSFPGRPEIVDFQVPELGHRQGWFFPGLRRAPTIVLCHGYASSRGELLTLVSALQDHQYNVFVFDFAAHGANAGVTTLGYREADELRKAVDALAARDDLDPTRFGFWGYNLGAYAALREAEGDKRIQALDDPELAAITRQMFLQAPEPREQAIIAHGNFVSLSDQEKREYENRVVSFFLLRLPPTVAKPPQPLH